MAKIRALICINTIHRFGCARIAEEHRKALVCLGHSAEIIQLPGNRETETFLDVPLSKKSYDVIIAIEYMPSKLWTESGSVIWVPMAELTYTKQLNACWSWMRVVWHNHDGFIKAKQICPWVTHTFLQFGIDSQLERNKLADMPRRILLQQRLRSLDAVNLADEIIKAFPDISCTIHDERRTIDGKINHHVIAGTLSHARQIDLLRSHDIYICPRTREGAGLIMHEAAWIGLPMIGPDAGTFDHTFPSQARIPVCTTGNAEGRLLDTAGYDKPVEHIISCIGQSRWPDMSESVRLDAIAARDAFYKGYHSAVLDGVHIPTPIKPGSNWRKQGIVINCCRGGGQGIFDAASMSLLETMQDWSWLSAASWPSNGIDEPEWIGSQYANGRTRTIGLDAAAHVHADIIILHWSAYLALDAEDNEISKLQYAALNSLIANRKVPLIVFVHEVAPQHWPASWMPDKVIFPSKHAQHDFMSATNLSCANYVLPHFIPNELQPNRVIGAPFKFLIFGRIVWSKVDIEFLRTLKPLLSQCGLDVIGMAENSLLNAIENAGIPFKHYTAFDYKSKGAALNACHVMLHFSNIRESYCMAAAEAMRIGCPVVTNRPELMELAPNGGIMLVNTPAQALAVCNELFVSGATYNRMSAMAESAMKDATPDAWLKTFQCILNACGHGKQSNLRVCIVICVSSMEEAILLPRALASTTNQGAHSIAIIDNSANDGVAEIISACTTNAIKSHRMLSRQIHTKCIWRAALLTDCDIILNLDPDDELLPGAVDGLMTEFVTDESVVFVWAKPEICDSNSSTIQHNTQFASHAGSGILSSIMAGNNVISHPWAVAKWALQLMVFDDELPHCTEKQIAIYAEEIGKCVFLNKVLYRYYSGRPGSVTVEKRDAQLRCHDNIIEKALARRADKDFSG